MGRRRNKMTILLSLALICVAVLLVGIVLIILFLRNSAENASKEEHTKKASMEGNTPVSGSSSNPYESDGR
jgi:hypothetical protein